MTSGAYEFHIHRAYIALFNLWFEHCVLHQCKRTLSSLNYNIDGCEVPKKTLIVILALPSLQTCHGHAYCYQSLQGPWAT